MAKKTHIKIRLVPESKPNSSFFYYVKKPAGGEKAKAVSAECVQGKLVLNSLTLYYFQSSPHVLNTRSSP